MFNINCNPPQRFKRRERGFLNLLGMGGKKEPDMGDRIARSVRLRQAAGGRLTKTIATAGTSTSRLTWSIWTKRGMVGTNQRLMGAFYAASDPNILQIFFDGSDVLRVSSWGSSWRASNAVFRDPHAWLHIVVAVDTALASPNNVRVYINQREITSWATLQNPFSTAGFGLAGATYVVGDDGGSNTYYEGLVADVHQIDGQQLTPSAFGRVSADTGSWVPKRYTGTYGLHGYHLEFANGSIAANLGLDSSGNGHTFNVLNISATPGRDIDWNLDTPTNNTPTLSLINRHAAGIENTYEAIQGTASALYRAVAASQPIPHTGKWYLEVEANVDANTRYSYFGLADSQGLPNESGGVASSARARDWLINIESNTSTSGVVSNNGAMVNGTAAFAYTSGMAMCIAVDADAGRAWIGKITGGGTVTWLHGDPVAGTGYVINNLPKNPQIVLAPYRDGTYASGRLYLNCGHRPFVISALPAGFKSIGAANMPAPPVLKPQNYFHVDTYAGVAGTTQTRNGYPFSPDVTWIKRRDTVAPHVLNDSTRGAGRSLLPSDASVEVANDSAGYLSAYTADGFTLNNGSSGAGTRVKESGGAYVAWNWKQDPRAGVDVVTYVGNGVNRTIAHNLGVAPTMMLIKRRSGGVDNWCIWHKELARVWGPSYVAFFTSGAPPSSPTVFNSTAPTSSAFSIGTATAANNNGDTYVAYLFADVPGFLKAGYYLGNGSAEGPLALTNFLPRFVMLKQIDDNGFDWMMLDTARNPFNVGNAALFPNSTSVEGVGPSLDFLSNGFKLRVGPDSTANAANKNYIYLAIAESPFKFANAR